MAWRSYELTGRGWWRLIGTHLMNDESVVCAVAQEIPAQAGADLAAASAC